LRASANHEVVSLRIKLGLALTAPLLGYALWLVTLRDLPLFQVQSVAISGLSGNAAPDVTSALELTAREMTTTNISVARLRAAVAAYPSVARVSVHTQFPHGVRIDVVERRPLARLDFNGTIVAVASNDEVLAGLRPSRSLPLLDTTTPPLADRVTDSLTREELRLLAAAPGPLRRHVYQIILGSEGLTARLRHGPLIFFGDDSLPHAKWDSAAAVLANASSAGARYIDVSLPGRPAADVGDPATEVAGGGHQGAASVATIVGNGQTAASSSTSG
jgi:cell division protein FtsQ